LERGAVSGKEVVWAFNDQTAFSKPLDSRRDLKSKCVQDGGYKNVVVGIDSEQMGFVSRVEDSLGTKSLMDEMEQFGARVVGEGAVGWSRLKDHSKPSVFHSLIGNGHADFDMLEEEEEVRRPEIPTMKESGRNVSLGGLSAGLGTGVEGDMEGGGNVVSSKGRLSGLVGVVEGQHPIVDQVFLVHQTGSSSNSLLPSDSAIENCNRIFWVKIDKNVAASVWGVGKEIGFSFPGREDVVLNGLYSLSNQGGVTTRKMWKERSKFVNEDS